MTPDEVLTELRRPFGLARLKYKPRNFGENNRGPYAQGFTYLDPRDYQDRLNDLFGLYWSVSYEPWGNDKIVATIKFRVTDPDTGAHDWFQYSSTGEPDDNSRGGNQGTIAEAQAFKRACAAAGLGRFLWQLPKVYGEVNPRRDNQEKVTGGYFTDRGIGEMNTKVRGVIQSQVSQGLLPEPTPESKPFLTGNVEDIPYDEPTDPVRDDMPEPPPPSSFNQGGKAKEVANNTASKIAEERRALLSDLQYRGKSQYGDRWADVGPNLMRIVAPSATHSNDLTVQQLQNFIAMLSQDAGNPDSPEDDPWDDKEQQPEVNFP